jgi:hypothetical protein
MTEAESTTGKELVRRNHVPLWDAVVEDLIDSMVATIKDEEMDEDVKGGVLLSKARKLTKLVDELDSGTTKYGSLSPIESAVDSPTDEPKPSEVATIAHVLQLSDDEVWKRLQEMTPADRQAYAKEVTNFKETTT